MDYIQTWCDDRYYCSLHFDTSLIDLDLDSRSQECEKAKTSAPIISQSLQSVETRGGIFSLTGGFSQLRGPHRPFLRSM